jgi:organic radical activating enzyme
LIYISEIFGPTIQGEGLKCGVVSIFIRVAKCNMSCSGFGVEYGDSSTKYGCDSYHAVDDIYKHQWQKMTKKEIIQKVESLIPKDTIPDIVITGGEPLIYYKRDDFQELLEYFDTMGHSITIETNGAIDIDIQKKYQKKILYSISVKLSNSAEEYNKRVNQIALSKMLSNKNSYLKFVIDKNSINTLDTEIKDIINITNIEKNRVFLMPMGSNATEIEQNANDTINMAIKNGYRYSDRLHIRVWNNKRGV